MTRAHAIELPHLHRVAIALILRGGPRYEGATESGLTHFLEHMVFRGAGPHATARDLLSAFEALGDEPDAYTCDDALGIVVDVEPRRLEDALALLEQVLLAPRYKDLETERDVILEERLALVDEHGRLADPGDVSRALVFGGHGLARPVIGEERDILRFGRRDLERLRTRLVRRDNVAVAIAGPISRTRAERGARRLIAALPPGAALVDTQPLPPPRGPRTGFQAVKGSAQTDLRFTFHAPGLDDPRAPALGVLLDVLAGSSVSRLDLRLVDSGLAYEAWADVTTYREASLVDVQVTLAHDKLGDATGEVLALLASLRRVSDDEVARATARRRHDAMRWKDDPRAQAEWCARRALFDLPTDRAAEAARADGVRPRDVAALAREVFRPDALTAVMVGSPSQSQRRAARLALKRWTATRSRA